MKKKKSLYLYAIAQPEVSTTVKPTPSLRQRIIDAWLDGVISYQQLAEHFDVSSAYVRQVLRPFMNKEERPRKFRHIDADLLDTARGVYNVLPSEVVGNFTNRYEDVTGAKPGLLFTPYV